MPKTQRGIYHNLRESKYTASNTEVVFYFSSEVYLMKFLERYEEHRELIKKRSTSIMKEMSFNTDSLADIILYKNIETRGFFVRLRGAKITWDDLEKYALRKMTERNTTSWQRMSKVR